MDKSTIKVIIAMAIVGVVGYYLFFKKDEKSETASTKTTGEKASDIISENPIARNFPPIRGFKRWLDLSGDVIGKIIDDATGDSGKIKDTTTEEPTVNVEIDYETITPESLLPVNEPNSVVFVQLANIIDLALDNYDVACNKYGWSNDWKYNTTNDAYYYMTIVNIMAHAAIETGLNDFVNKAIKNGKNIFNITGTTTPKGCPYIGDVGHNYLPSINRKDGNIYQKFRAYQHYYDAIMDYLDLINRAKKSDGKYRYRTWIFSYAYNDATFLYMIGKEGYYTADPSSVAKTCDNIRKTIISYFDEEVQKILNSAPKHPNLVYK